MFPLLFRRGFDYFYGMYGGFADYFTHISAEPESPDNAAFDLHEHYKENITSSKIFSRLFKIFFKTFQDFQDFLRFFCKIFSRLHYSIITFLTRVLEYRLIIIKFGFPHL